SHQEVPVMPRTPIFTRFGITLFGLLTWPIPGVTAGPIITASSRASQAGSGDSPGEVRGALTTHLLTVVGQRMSEVSLPIRAWPGTVRDVLPRDPTVLSSGSRGGGPAPASDTSVSGRAGPMSATADHSPRDPSPGATQAGSLDRSPETPTASGASTTPA